MNNDVAPVLSSGVAAKRRAQAAQKPASFDSMFSAMLGENSSESSFFPDSAKEYAKPESVDKGQPQATATPANNEPQFPVYPGEPLISPAVALVAPDVTPDALLPIDPSEVPQPPGGGPEMVELPDLSVDQEQSSPVLQTILGRRPQGPAAPAQESVPPPTIPLHIPGIPSAPSVNLNEDGVPNPGSNYNIIAAGMTPGIPMPDHVVNPNSGRRLFEVLRRVQPRK